jgi:diadenosine tetraphosphate (Ap4A) HIT family hydrolase
VTTGTTCPFCDPEPGRVFLRLRHVFVLWDGFPVAEGHALIVTDRHVASWFDASDAERAELVAAIDAVCGAIRERGTADGFNVGVNVGAAAGQTVPHLHLHVIPRRHGDVPDPRGGVRHVIPGKGNYLVRGEAVPSRAADAAVGLDPADDAARSWIPIPTSGLDPAAAPAHGPLLTTGESDPLLPRLEQDLAQATRVDIAVAFVMPSGIDRLYPHFDDLLARPGCCVC